MLIYRIEAEDGLGPYRLISSRTLKQQELAKQLLSEHNDGTHPTPQQEGVKDVLVKNGLMGFSSVEQLNYWFKNHLNALKNSGYYMTTYKVNPQVTTVTPNQVVFLYGTQVKKELL